MTDTIDNTYGWTIYTDGCSCCSETIENITLSDLEDLEDELNDQLELIKQARKELFNKYDE